MTKTNNQKAAPGVISTHRLDVKFWRFKKDSDGDYKVNLGDTYIGLISPHGLIEEYQLVLDGRHIGYSKSFFRAKLKFIFKYYIMELFDI